jgi:hypothetical protein
LPCTAGKVCGIGDVHDLVIAWSRLSLHPELILLRKAQSSQRDQWTVLPEEKHSPLSDQAWFV